MKIKLYILSAIIFFMGNENIQLFSNYKPLTQEQIQKCVNSNVREVISLKGQWNKETNLVKNEKVTIPYTEYNINETEFTKTFSLDVFTIKNKNVALSFLGLNGVVELFINDKFLSKIDGECLQHTIPIPENLLKTGQNNIRLHFLPITDFQRNIIHSSIFSLKPFIGIFREPLLMLTSKTFIRTVNSQYNKSATKVSIEVQSGSIAKNNNTQTNFENYTIEYIIQNRTTAQIVGTDNKIIKVSPTHITTINFDITNNILNQWTPNNPELYDLIIKLKRNGIDIDAYTINIANRNIEIKNNKFILNGNSFQLLSMEYDEYFNAEYGNTRSYNSLEDDIRKIKAMGVNTLYLSYSNPSPTLMRLCNENGLFVLLSHLSPSIPTLLNTSDKEYSRNSLSRTLTTYSNNPSLLGIGFNNKLITPTNTELATKRGLLTFTTLNAEDSIKKIELDFYLLETTSEKYTSIIKQLNNVPYLIYSKYNITGEIFKNIPQSVLFTRQCFAHKKTFEVYKTSNAIGFIASSYRNIPLAFPLYNTFNISLTEQNSGLINNENIERPAYNIIKQLYLNERSTLLTVDEFEIEYSIFYLIFSIVLVLAISYILKRDNRLYTLFIRSIRRGHNLYCDMRDERISYSVGIYILLLLEIIGTSIATSIFIDYQIYNTAFSYFISLILPFPKLLSLIKPILYSEILIFIATILINIIITAIIIIIIKIIFKIKRVRIAYKKIYYLLAFVFSPILLVPIIAIFLGKTLTFANIFSTAFIVIMILLIIIIFKRLIQSIAIILDKNIRFSTIILIGTLLILIIFPTYLYFNFVKTLPFIVNLIF